MRFNTHDTTPKRKNPLIVRVLFGICYGLFYGFFLFAAVTMSIYSRSIVPAIIVLFVLVIFTYGTFFSSTFLDMERSYIEIIDDKVIVVDYKHHFFKSVRQFNLKDIAYSEKVMVPFPFWKWRFLKSEYTVYKDRCGIEMFKIISISEAVEILDKYIKT